MAATPQAPAKKPDEWSPRVWEGSDFFAWIRMICQHRFAVEFPLWYIAGIVTGMSLSNTILRWLQHGLYKNQIASTRIQQAPIFVIGHWRTGTTLLHELLILDDRFTSPNSAQCLMPCHFLLSEDVFKSYLGFLMPKRRPMDNMPMGWSNPQEDEFALCLLGHPSTYTDLAFPNHPLQAPGALDLSGLSPQQLRAWKRDLYRFVQAITFKDPRRLVMKSPPHTARIPVLLELFPDARFVHIKRNPYTLFASTVNMWLSMARKHGFQKPRGGPAWEEKVFSEFRIMFDRLEESQKLIPADRFYELRYEDLIGDIVGGMQKVYQGLALGGFETVRPKLEQYVARNKNYEANKYQITDELRAKIRDRWGDIIEKLGYD